MSDGFIKRVNDRMDEEIKKKTFIDATDSLSAKIRNLSLNLRQIIF